MSKKIATIAFLILTAVGGIIFFLPKESSYHLGSTRGVFLNWVDQVNYEYAWHIGGQFGDASTLFQMPRIAVNMQGDLYILDTGHNRLLHFANNGKLLGETGYAGQGMDQFLIPHAIQVSSQEEVFTLEYGIRRIKIYDKNLKLLGWYMVENGGGNFTVDSRGNTYVTTTNENDFLKVYSKSGQNILDFGNRLAYLGTRNQKVYYPYQFAADKSDNVHIVFFKSDTCYLDKYLLGKNRFSRTILCLPEISSTNNEEEFYLASGDDGYLYLLFIPLNVIYKLDENDNVQCKINLPPIPLIPNPKYVFLAIDANSNLYLSDYTNRLIVKYVPTRKSNS